MMHICFVVDNPLTMLQKTVNNEMSFFDQVKYSLETVVKAFFRSAYSNSQQTRAAIHLFVTSSTEPVSSHEQNHQMHLMHQIKNLECTIPTFSAQVIESALFHLGKFRCLNETETFLGYRQGSIFESALIFYITDNSNRRQMNKIYRKLFEKKLQLRAQYKFVTIKYCSPSPSETNMNVQKFKSYIQNERESLMMEQLMKKMHGVLYHVYQPEEMVSFIQNTISKYVPTLAMEIQSKQYNIYNKQIMKIQFPSILSQSSYLQRLKKINQTKYSQYFLNSKADQSLFFVEALPLARRTQIPLPFQITPKHLNQNTIIIDQFQGIQFQVDFAKEYIGEVDPLMKYLFNAYQIVENKTLVSICKQFSQEKKFPLFYERKRNQYLIGYLRMHYPAVNTTKNKKAIFQIHVSFSNFSSLNACIRSFKERKPSQGQYFQNYISTLPIFYHKFLKNYLQNILMLQPAFENINAKPIGVTNLRFYEQRMAERKEMLSAFKKSYQDHEKNQSQCCSVYSKEFQNWEKGRAKQFGQYLQSLSSQQSQTKKFFQTNLYNFEKIKQALGIYDYLRVQKVHSTSLKKEHEKYNIRRDDDQVDQLVGDLLGNPFKRINKKVKINDQAQSVWLEPDQVEQMKELLEKQLQIFKQSSHLLIGQNSQDFRFKSENTFDRLGEIKQKIAHNNKMIEEKIRTYQAYGDQAPSNENESSKRDQELQNFQIGETKGQIVGQIRTNHEDSQVRLTNYISEIKEVHNQENGHNQDQISLYLRGSEKRSEQIMVSSQCQQKKTLPESSSSSDILKQVSEKFSMNKSLEFDVPSQLIEKDLYLKNKRVFSELITQDKS